MKLNLSRADLKIESFFVQPQFGLFRDTLGLMHQLFSLLQTHGLQLQHMKIERGTGSIGDYHLLCHLYDFAMAVLVRPDKVETNWFQIPENFGDTLGHATLDALTAVQRHLPSLAFRAHNLAIALHGELEGTPVKDYLSRFVTNTPAGLGTQTGSGAVFYFGAKDDRLLTAITVDFSAMVPGGLFVRPFVVWDAAKVAPANLLERAILHVREILNALGLEIPTLRY
jgi:hypothetical protein